MESWRPVLRGPRAKSPAAESRRNHGVTTRRCPHDVADLHARGHGGSGGRHGCRPRRLRGAPVRVAAGVRQGQAELALPARHHRSAVRGGIQEHEPWVLQVRRHRGQPSLPRTLRQCDLSGQLCPLAHRGRWLHGGELRVVNEHDAQRSPHRREHALRRVAQLSLTPPVPHLVHRGRHDLGVPLQEEVQRGLRDDRELAQD
mmetsp:Transcript_5551/g.15508  ORF Transcript_5551/g.15508 Transcript_5551/m.15508 type:complete len:201 (+) Transcript_5551:1154-1756(+)